MQPDLTPCFDAEELPLATRLIEARALRLGVSAGCLFRAAARDIAFDEAARPSELTLAAVESAEARALAAKEARDQAAADAAAAVLESAVVE